METVPLDGIYTHTHTVYISYCIRESLKHGNVKVFCGSLVRLCEENRESLLNIITKDFKDTATGWRRVCANISHVCFRNVFSFSFPIHWSNKSENSIQAYGQTAAKRMTYFPAIFFSANNDFFFFGLCMASDHFGVDKTRNHK